jgi:hypothetical protein
MLANPLLTVSLVGKGEETFIARRAEELTE